MARDDELRSWSKRRLEQEVLKLRALLKANLGAATTLHYESGVSMDDGRPFVRLMWGDEMAQQTPDETRQMAIHLVETASAAEFDAALVDVLVNRFEFEMGQAVSVLVFMREERMKRRPELRTPGVDEVGDPEMRDELRREIEGDD